MPKATPFEFQFISARLVRFSLRPSHFGILGVDEFKELYEQVDESAPAAPAPEPPQQAA